MFHRVRHSLASAKEVVWPTVVGAVPYVLALLAIGGIGFFVWQWGAVDSVSENAEPVGSGEDGYEEALTKGEAGDLESARGQMQGLAMMGGGDIRAHWWVAQDLLTQAGESESGAVTRAALVQARSHLMEVVDRDESNLDALPILVQTHVLLGEVRAALNFSEEHASRLPDLYLVAADLAGRLRDWEARERHAIAAAEHFERETANPDLDEIVRREAKTKWVRAELAMGNFEFAREKLEDGTDDLEWREKTRPLLIQSWLGLIQQGLAGGDFEGVMQLLKKAEQALGPALGPCRPLIEVGGALAAQSQSSLQAELESFYQRMAQTEGEDPALHLALGSMALALKNTEDGLRQLERAIEVNPKHVIALNNFGYGLAFLADPPELDRAMKILDRAIVAGKEAKKIPPNCWETRGQILAKLERWSEAAIDLERALFGMKGHQDIHGTLAVVYREIGQAELADQHQLLAGGTVGGEPNEEATTNE